ncbi:copper amine oxidase N-terminal domain-containing protein [Paenibacillus thalictri]|uniref:Copper amine oxidase N-terminal domain-containing protein n=1 Tax=Paenibacillus thalictri TaxID=2527873 RepID=A0A4Q9DX33_9BACL|nr:copper amine oxidase N-terminal domain-containing protein [Paenibacillus thalictri]TBL80590.1 copper amine oxidase N-terminal domain-containing protein [Paenibacillus thalictri]
MRRKWIALLALTTVFGMFGGVAYSAGGAKLVINGALFAPEVPPQMIDGNTMVPIRTVSEGLGADVRWDEVTRTVNVEMPDTASLQRQIDLLQSALAPASADEAVNKWAEWVKKRNGAAQYALLSPELRKRTLSSYKELNWVTGVSSPWVDNYEIAGGVPAGETGTSYEVTFHLKTSSGSAGQGTVKVTVEPQKNGDWQITGLQPVGDSSAINGIVIF